MTPLEKDHEQVQQYGPAFPIRFEYSNGLGFTNLGISARDYLAAKASERMLEATPMVEDDEHQMELFRVAARKCYEFADAMMEVRK